MLNFQGTVYIRNGIPYSLPLIGGSIFLVNPGSVLIINQHELMKQMLMKLKMQGYRQASLAVQKMNYAVRMYRKVGFEIVDENDEEYIMICRL